MNALNPFSVVSYMGKDYFCDRVAEIQSLVQALQNGRNITLVSPRRMGKTGLIHHLFQSIPASHAYCFYVDIYNTASLAEFTRNFAESVLNKQVTTLGESFWKDLLHIFSSLRPSFTMDPISGMPQCSVEIAPSREEMSLRQIFDYLEHANLPCYVAFDEFQVIEEYKDCKMEATLRSFIQQLNNVHFVFAGSKKHVLTQMFTSAQRPFFQSTQMMEIGVIDCSVYYEFAAAHFARHAQNIQPSVFSELYSMVEGHTWYVQMWLNRLYQSGVPEITYNDCLLVLNQILEENALVYQTYLSLITLRQRELVSAIAKEGKVHEVGNVSFLQKYHLGSASTVRSAVLSLLDKELIFKSESDAYSVYDRFFALWLKHH